MTDLNIFPWREDGRESVVSWARMKSGETFQRGEPIYLNSSGQLAESGDDPAINAFGGIALGPISYVRGTYAAAGTATTRNPESGAAFAALDQVPYVKALPGGYLISPFLSAGATTHMAPAGSTLSSAGTTLANATAIAMISDAAGFQITSGEWQIDLSATVGHLRIEKFLDSMKRDITRSGQPASYVICAVLFSQWTGASDVAGAIASVAPAA